MKGEVCLLFLLRDRQGRGLILAQTPSKDKADAFGRTHLPEFSEALEIDPASRKEAEEFWGVRTVRLVSIRLDPDVKNPRSYPRAITHIWVRSPLLPPEVEEDDLLTMEDRRAITLDHIERTSDLIGQVQIMKWA